MLVVALGGLGTLRARAAGEDPQASSQASRRGVYLEKSACDATSPFEVASVLRVELFNRLLDGAPRGEAYRVAIDCSSDIVVIAVRVPGGPSKSLQTNLAGAPANVRSRIVGLAIAELVRDLDREPRPIPPPPAPPRPRPRDEPPARPPSPSSRAVDLGAFASTATFQLKDVWLAGGGLRFDYAYQRFCAGLDAAVLTTTERFEQGTAQVFLSYVSPSVAWQETWGPARARLGAGYALGVARLSGYATVARAFAGTTTGAWTAPYAFASFALAITGGFSVDARGQLGWVASPVVGEVSGGPDVALEGLWVSVQAGVTIAL